MADAPRVAAALTAVPRSASVAELASTSTILQSGQAALAMSRSSEISPAHPVSFAGSGDAWPFWLTFLKQPFAVVQAARPYCDRYTARSASAVGSSLASTMATMRPLPPLAGRLYAERSSGGP